MFHLISNHHLLCILPLVRFSCNSKAHLRTGCFFVLLQRKNKLLLLGFIHIKRYSLGQLSINLTVVVVIYVVHDSLRLVLLLLQFLAPSTFSITLLLLCCTDGILIRSFIFESTRLIFYPRGITIKINYLIEIIIDFLILIRFTLGCVLKMSERRQQSFVANRVNLNSLSIFIYIGIISGLHVETETILLGIFFVCLDNLLPYPTCARTLIEHIHHGLLGETTCKQTELIKFLLDTVSCVQTIHLIGWHYILLGFLTKTIISSTLNFLRQL